MSSVRLLVLGIVYQHQQAHGYAVRQTLMDWHVEAWAMIQTGSVYHALKQLSKEGKLQALGAKSSQKGPGRLVYGITPAGEAELFALLQTALGSTDLATFSAGLALRHLLTPAQQVYCLQMQQQQSQTFQQLLRHLKQGMPALPHSPHQTDILDLWANLQRHLEQWSARLCNRLQTPASAPEQPIYQGDLYWLHWPRADGSSAPVAHPHVVIQDDLLNHSRIESVVVCGLTSNPRRIQEPGNLQLQPGEGNLEKPSIVLVSQLDTVPKSQLSAWIGRLSPERVQQILAGLRLQQQASRKVRTDTEPAT